MQITVKGVDFSFSPTLVVPLQTEDNKKYKVRTLLDSGSGANWICKQLLPLLKCNKLGEQSLHILTFNGIKKGKFQLVEEYFDKNNEKQALVCFVVDDFTQHIFVKGIIKCIFQHYRKKKTLEKVVDPTIEIVDHDNINKGIGLILGEQTQHYDGTHHF